MAHDELNAVTAATEEATVVIMEATEAIEATAEKIDKENAADMKILGVFFGWPLVEKVVLRLRATEFIFNSSARERLNSKTKNANSSK